MTLPKRLARKEIYTSKWINVYVDRVEMSSGTIIEEYHQLDFPFESVVVILQNEEGKLLLIRNLRYTTSRVEWELVSGGIDLSESPLEAAQREVSEETGLEARDLKEVCTYNPANGMSNQKIHILSGRIQGGDSQILDTDEVESVHWMSPEEVKDLIRAGEITDGVALTPLLLYFSGLMEE